MASGWYDFVAGGRPLATEWDDYVSKQTVMVFASTAARDTALATVAREGMLCYITADEQFYARNATGWVRAAWSAANGRTGFSLTGNTQSIPNTTLTTVTFHTEVYDSDGFIAVTATTATVPSGLDGLYVITGKANLTTPTNGAVEIVAGGITYDFPFTAPSSAPTATVIAPLSAAHTIHLSVYQAVGAAQNVNVRLDAYRMGP
jgi:hypothetical protein